MSVPDIHTHTKIIGVWKIQIPEFSLRFGISILKVTAGFQYVSVILEEQQIIQTAKQCGSATLLKNANTEGDIFHCLSVLF